MSLFSFKKDGSVAWVKVGEVSDLTISDIGPVLPYDPWMLKHGQFSKCRPDQQDAYVKAQRTIIPSYDTLTRAQAEKVLILLSEHFSIAPPQLKWSKCSRRGRYNGRKHSVAAGPNSWRGLTNCLLHEFAHALTHKRFPDARPHGAEFIAVLWEVVCVWHDDPHAYAWAQEYAHIAKISAKMMAQYEKKQEANFAIAAEHAECEAAKEFIPSSK